MPTKPPPPPVQDVRGYRNTRLYRPLARVQRVYNRRIVAALHERGFRDFSPSFPQILSNLDTEGTQIGVLAARAGVTRQAAGQLLADIERCGYVQRRASPDDARAIVVQFTARGRQLLAAVFQLVEEIEASFAQIIGQPEFQQLRANLVRIADEIDPGGTFGSGDENYSPAPSISPAGAGRRASRRR